MIYLSTTRLCILSLALSVKSQASTCVESARYFLYVYRISFPPIVLFVVAASVALLISSICLVSRRKFMLLKLRTCRFLYFQSRTLNVIVVSVVLAFGSIGVVIKTLCGATLAVIKLLKFFRRTWE